MTPEFSLIDRYFKRAAKPGRAVLGIGDDCALIRPAPNTELAISTDTLVAGNHFFADTDAEKLGHKALAVNLSDLAAMGAIPRYVTLALTLPNIDEAWLAAFARGFFALAAAHDIELIGGDTTRGPFSMTLTIFGEIEAGCALRREGAQAGDDVWVSGTVGGAALAVQKLLGKRDVQPHAFAVAEERLLKPQARIQLGQSLIGIASAAIDISDGLVADLGHICERSQLVAVIERATIPFSPALNEMPADVRDSCGLAGGDDYELCFTAAPEKHAQIALLARTLSLPLTRVGTMVPRAPGDKCVTVLDENQRDVTPASAGYDQFN